MRVSRASASPVALEAPALKKWSVDSPVKPGVGQARSGAERLWGFRGSGGSEGGAARAFGRHEGGKGLTRSAAARRDRPSSSVREKARSAVKMELDVRLQVCKPHKATPAQGDHDQPRPAPGGARATATCASRPPQPGQRSTSLPVVSSRRPFQSVASPALRCLARGSTGVASSSARARASLLSTSAPL